MPHFLGYSLSLYTYIPRARLYNDLLRLLTQAYGGPAYQAAA